MKIKGLALIGLTTPCLLLAQPVKENMLKTALTYNFIMFTEWPDEVMEKSKNINICVNTESEMHKALSELEEKTIRQQRLKVLPLNDEHTDLKRCHVLYLDRIDKDRWHTIRNRLGEASALTIADDMKIGLEGAIITLVRDDNKMVYDLNRACC